MHGLPYLVLTETNNRQLKEFKEIFRYFFKFLGQFSGAWSGSYLLTRKRSWILLLGLGEMYALDPVAKQPPYISSNVIEPGWHKIFSQFFSLLKKSNEVYCMLS